MDVIQTEEAREVWDRGALDAACDHLRELQSKAVR